MQQCNKTSIGGKYNSAAELLKGANLCSVVEHCRHLAKKNQVNSLSYYHFFLVQKSLIVKKNQQSGNLVFSKMSTFTLKIWNNHSKITKLGPIHEKKNRWRVMHVNNWHGQFHSRVLFNNFLYVSLMHGQYYCSLCMSNIMDSYITVGTFLLNVRFYSIFPTHYLMNRIELCSK